MQHILDRDNKRCGIHVGGCGLPISENDQSIDHMIPQSFFKGFLNEKRFHETWNLQPMHRNKCNSSRIGQIVDKVDFICKCHGTYITKEGDREVMYKEKDKWKSVKYYQKKKSLYLLLHLQRCCFPLLVLELQTLTEGLALVYYQEWSLVI